MRHSKERQPTCPSCDSPLGQGSLRARGWERSPYGDEFTDELHCCLECEAWSLVTLVDRFASSDEVTVHGPLSESEITDQQERIGELNKMGRN